MRLVWLDVLKGISIMLVVAFHFLFDLSQFSILDYDLTGWFWTIAALPVLAIFIGGAGIAMQASRMRAWRQGKPKRLFVYRTLKKTLFLAICAGLVTLVTGLLFPQETIFFGILHLIAVSRIFGLILIDTPYFAFSVGLLFLVSTPLVSRITVTTRWFLPLGCAPDNFVSFDYFPLFPWFGVFCIGMFLGHILFTRSNQSTMDQLAERRHSKMVTVVAFLGRHTLSIYLLHQPIIVTVLWLLGYMRL